MRISKYIYICQKDQCHWDNKNYKDTPCRYKDNCVYRLKKLAEVKDELK